VPEVWSILVIVGGYASVIVGLPWLAARARRRAIGVPLLSIVDEIYSPAAHRTQIEIQVQLERRLPTPPAEDT
jgi:hypothetical protein